MDNNIDIERAKVDFEYFYNNILQFQDECGNRVAPPPLKGYQKTFLNWIQDEEKKGLEAIYFCENIKYKM